MPDDRDKKKKKEKRKRQRPDEKAQRVPRPPFERPSKVRWAPTNPGGADKDRKSATMDVRGFDAGLPILLVPIRLETRFVFEPKPGELRIRILPDTFSVDGSAPASKTELEVARGFWTHWLETDKPRGRETTWRQFVRRVGPERAGYLTQLVRPTIRNGQPVFPDVDPGEDGPALARLLPRRWMAMGWVGDDLAFRAYGAPITQPVVLSPDPDAPTQKVGHSGLKVDRRLDWMFDYPAAVKRGMAITVPFEGDAAPAAGGLSTLLVLGLDSDQIPKDATAELEQLFESHARGAGLAFVPQGTPTNNTRAVPSGYRSEFREPTEAAALAPGPDDDGSDTRVDPHGNAVRLAQGLGLGSRAALRRVPFAEDPEFTRSRDMRVALFEAVLGTYLRQLLATYPRKGGSPIDAFDRSAIGSVRRWFADWLTGGAPLPTLRVGPQPYGVLPVMRRSAEGGSGVPGQIAGIVDELLGEWRTAVLAVPTLDHNATDQANPATAADEAREAVTAVLANNPHPRILSVRNATDWSDQSPLRHTPAARVATGGLIDRTALVPGQVELGGIVIDLDGGYRYEYDQAADLLNDRYAYTLKVLYDQALQQVLQPLLHEPLRPLPTGRVVLGGTPRTDADIRTVEQQIEIWVQLDASIDNGFAVWTEVAEFIPEFHEFCQDVIDQVARHELRQRPLRWLGIPGFDGVLGRDNAQLLLTRFDGYARRWSRPVAAPADPDGGVTARDYLRDLRGRLGRPRQQTELDPEFLDSAPLLYQLLDTTRTAGDGMTVRRGALGRLAEVDPEELEWLVRETLGLGSHRLDAWHTSLASERLARMREKKEEGIYVGNYGLVLDLVPTGARASNGFVHAPSLAHAASAAVLRSGWLARGAPDASAPAAIDLASDRVRGADWLLSGVRQGQELGSLLGYEFERALHDQELDVAIRPLRVAAAPDPSLESAGDEPVDGIALLDLYRGGSLAVPIAGLGLSARAEASLTGALDALVASFDAVDDAATFESVHQLVVGNLERASAVIDAFGPAGGPPPELLGVRTPRGAVSVDTRVLVIVDASAADAKDEWSVGTRDRLDPALDAWVATLLPPPGQVGFVALQADGTEHSVRLSQLAVSALDALYLASEDPTRAALPLHRLTDPVVGARVVDIRAGDASGAAVSLTELQLLAVELRRLLDESAPAGPDALWSPEKVEASEVDEAPVLSRVTPVLKEGFKVFKRAGNAQTWTDLPPTHAAWLARAGLAVADPSDPEAMAEIGARAARRRSAADAVMEVDLDGARVRVATALGTAAPLLPDFVFGSDAYAVLFPNSLATPDEVDEWLDALGSVRPRVGILSRALFLADLAGSPAAELRAGQAPAPPGEPWAALHRPDPGTGGRTVVAAATHGTVEPGTRLVGLVVDRWSDRLPRGDQVTGVAFQFDGPSAQPPQSILLAVPPEGEPWTLDLLVDTVLETVEWAMLRCVALDDLGDYGHAIPTTFIPGDLDPTLPTGGAT